jgi:hypothetical protein
MNMEQQTIEKAEMKNSTDLSEEEGCYIYCLIGNSEEGRFACPAIGGRGDEVYSISYQDVAAVVSASPVMKYPISRENTLTHQKILEELMNDFTVLPVKFGTVASSKNGSCATERIREEVLKVRYEELKNLLLKMDGKTELGLKAFWVDMKTIFQEIVDENIEVKKLRQKLISKPTIQPFGEKATLGEMVKDALERKKAQEEKDILNVLKNACADWRSNKVFGDEMITNSSFLVEKSEVGQFDGLVDGFGTTYDGRTKFKYVGPMPPINFAELVIVLEG